MAKPKPRTDQAPGVLEQIRTEIEGVRKYIDGCPGLPRRVRLALDKIDRAVNPRSAPPAAATETPETSSAPES